MEWSPNNLTPEEQEQCRAQLDRFLATVGRILNDPSVNLDSFLVDQASHNNKPGNRAEKRGEHRYTPNCRR